MALQCSASLHFGSVLEDQEPHKVMIVTLYDLTSCLLQDFEEGNGSLPQDGQQVTFDYTAYNESGARIDSTYQKGRPAQTRLGINGLIPGMLLYTALLKYNATNATLLEIAAASQALAC